MKKTVLGLFASLFFVAGLFFTSCNNIEETLKRTIESTISPTTLQAKINNIPEGEEYSLDGEEINEGITIKKSITLTNADFGGKTIAVYADGVTLKNITNAKIIVGKDVKSFNLKNCTINNISINGGEKIVIQNSTIDSSSVNKESVCISLEAKSKINSIEVKKNDVKIECKKDDTVVEQISVNKDVTTLNVAGSGKIEKIVALGNITVKPEDNSTIDIDSIKSTGTVTYPEDRETKPEISENAPSAGDEFKESEDVKDPANEEPKEDVKDPANEEPKQTLKIVFEECSNGIMGHIERMDGTELKIDKGSWNKTGSYEDSLHISVNNRSIAVINIGREPEFFYPFVEPNKEITVTTEMERACYNSMGERQSAEKIDYGKATITPTSGIGTAKVIKQLKYDYSEDGTFNITQMPEIEKVTDFTVVLELAKSNNWDEGGLYFGGIYLGIRECGTYNFYKDGHYTTTTGFEFGFTYSYVNCYFEDDNHKKWCIRIDDGIDEPKYGVKLLSKREIREKTLSSAKIVATNAANGIKFNFVQEDESPLILERTNDIEERINLFIDGKQIAIVYPETYTSSPEDDKISSEGIYKLEFFYPFVEPNKSINITANIWRAEKVAGEIVQKYVLKELEPIEFTPTEGYGTLQVTKAIEYNADNYGNVTLTQIPEVKLNNNGKLTDLPSDASMSIQFGFGRGNDWDDGFWLGGIWINSSEWDNSYEFENELTKNYFTDGFGVKTSRQQVFIYPELHINYYLDNGPYMESYSCRFYDDKINVYTKNLKLINNYVY